ncbi:MAG: UDP-N-acetylglucosamine 2-epimerase [Candidatus Helarchaeota archaeon]
MLYTVIGTKGQAIKMFPLLRELKERGIDYFHIDAGQHVWLKRLFQSFNLKAYDSSFYHYKNDIQKENELLLWFLKNLVKFGFSSKFTPKKDHTNLCLIHGDAPPALLGTLIFRLKQIPIAHIEAGERTYSLSQPFPEEIIRILVDKLSRYKFAFPTSIYRDSQKSDAKNIFKISENTLLDAVRYCLEKGVDYIQDENYILFTVHRYETIINKNKMKILIEFIKDFSKENRVIFPIHPSTKRKLQSFGFLDDLKSNSNVLITDLIPYQDFIAYISKSKFLITDGGGPQQESYYLGKPCMLIRNKSERSDFPNTYITGFNREKMDFFIHNYKKFKTYPIINKNIYPSKEISVIIEKLI